MRLRKECIALCAGALLGVGFIIPSVWAFSILGVALLINEILATQSWHKAGLISGIGGFIWYALVLAPTFWGVLPLDWFGIEGLPMQVLAVALSWLLSALVPAFGTMFFGMGIYLWKSRTCADLILIPALWVLSEWIGAFLISIVSAGPGSLLGAHFTYGALGYLLANDIVLLQAARIGGIYALSFMAAFAGALIYITLTTRSKRMRTALFVLAAVIVLAWAILRLGGFPSSMHAPSGQSFHVAIMSRYVPPRLRPTQAQAESDFEDAYQFVKPLRGVDLLVFPEDTAFLRATPDGSHDAAIRGLGLLGMASSSPLVIDSDDLLRTDGSLMSRVSFWHGPSDVTYGYKQMFMPFGEYMPYLYRGILTVAGGRELLDTVTAVRGYMPGPIGGIGIEDGVRIAVRFCDEAFSPELYRSEVADGANVLVDISSQSWFHESRMIYSQMQNVAKVRAAESERPFVQSGNMSPAFVLDAHGRVLAETEWGRPEVLQVPIMPQSGKTLYVMMGERILMLPILIIGILIILMGMKSKKQKKVPDSE